MHFHTNHGINIILEENNTRAIRAESFCNGITFSASPIGINEHVTVIIKTINSWSGALRLGVTTHNPETIASLPKYACPDLINKTGFWADAISENLAANSSRITFFISENGSMQLFINNEHQGSHLTKLPIREPLWVLIDIYGNTKSVKYVPDDAVPYEILSRGPDAVRAFRVAEISGTLPVYRTRLMLLGQDGVGKTRLKQHLTGRRYNDEKTAGSIDTSGWCEIIKGEPSTWTANDDEEEKKETENGEHSVKDGYYQAIATNIVRELIMIRHHHEDDKKSKTLKASLSRSSVHSHLRTARKDLRSTTKHHCPRNKSQDDQSCEERVREDLLRDLPDQVIDLVDSMLQEADINEDWDKKEPEPPQESAPNIMLSLWDFSGKSVYHTTHQVFLSSRAIYLLVFNLCQDLDAPAVTPIKSDNGSSVEHEESELTNLDYLVFWMNCIHAHAAPSVVTPSDDDGVTLSPPIIIVGTHKKGLHDDPDTRQKMISEKFQKIQVKLAGKPFQRHVVSSFFAVENNDEDDEEIQKLRVCIEEVAKREPYMGEEISIKWLRFEDIVSNLVEKGINFADIDQIREIARGEGIDPEEGLRTMLHFYHDLGVIIYYGGTIGAVDEILMHTVILHPQWLIGVFGLLINGNSSDKKWPNFISSWVLLEREGLLEDRLINHVWRNYLDQKSVLLALMEKFDLLCEKVPPKLVQANLLAMEEWQKCFYVPCRLRKCTDTENIIPNSNRTIVFYLDFNGFLPDGLFHRLLTRIARWSQKFSGIGPKMYHRLARFFMDNNHDFILQMSALRFASIKVIIARVSNFDDNNDNNQSTDQHLPSPQLCAKIRNFLESTLVDLREMWIKRLSYKTCIQCPCDKICTLHGQKSCADEICKHYLQLDECLANKVVCCDYRRIKTSFIRKCFPAALKQAKTGPIIPENIVTKTWYNETVILEVGMLDDTGRMPLVPVWVKGASKLLNAGSEGNDWTALATKLGYKQVMIDHFSEDLNPGLALITDWIYNSGNNSLSIDMLVACLNQIHRDDIVDLIHQSLVDEDNRPPVFISYHWDNQDEVLLICNRLEKTGIRCWMDIGQMGGGDHLYNKIYEGITHSKVLIACISPKYTVSHNCNREASLADLLHKPIVPLMIQPTPWPPPGPMGLLFSQLIYIDFHGTGGHGGSGIHADWESRFNELYLQLTKYTTPKYAENELVDMVGYTAPTRRTSDLASLRASRITLTDFVTMPLVNNEENEALPEELIVIPSLQAQNRGIVTRCTICRIL